VGEYGYETVARALADAGIEHVFGLMGNGNMALITCAAMQHGVQYTASRHDAGALCLAQGYAFATGAAAVATVTYGPGLSNALTALRAGVDLGSPFVLLLGDLDAPGAFSPHDIDHRAHVEITGAGWQHVSAPGDLRLAVFEVLERARAEGRPYVLNVPMSLLHGTFDVEPGTGGLRGIGVLAPSDEAIGSALEALRSAARPVVLAGVGAVTAGAVPALALLAERSGALIATTLRARGSFQGNPFLIGLSGSFASPVARDLLAGSDLVVAFGASLDRWTTEEGRLLAGARVVQVDRCVEALGRRVPVDVAVHADARTAAEAMLTAWGEATRTGYRTSEVARRIASFQIAGTFEDDGGEDGVDPRSVMVGLDRMLPRERMITVDGGHLISWPSVYLEAGGEGSFLPTLGAGAVGHALATAIGAWIGDPSRIGVCVVGDGGLMMSLPELDTAVRTQARLIIVVINDSAYSAEVHKLHGLGLTPELAEFEPRDIAAIMRAIGGQAVSVRSLTDLERVEEHLDRLDSPLLVDVHVTRRVVADRFRS
jgi:acetolactate synthase I/II/III large subunit